MLPAARAWRAAWLGLAVALVWAAASAAPARASDTQESIFQDDSLLVYPPRESVDRTLATLQSLGVERIRVSVYWRLVSPRPAARREPDFDAADPAAYPDGAWRRYDDLVELAREHGIAVYFNLVAPAPSWATGRPGENDPDGAYAPSPGEFGRFVHAVGRRYSGHFVPSGAEGTPLPRVRFWSIWNEPNIGEFLRPQFGPDPAHPGGKVEVAPRIYRSLVDAGWRALRRTGHRRDTILVGELAPHGHTLRTMHFLRQLFCLDDRMRYLSGAAASARGCPTHAQATAFPRAHPGLFRASGWAHHPYALIDPPWKHEPDPDFVALADTARLERGLDSIFRRYGSARRIPIYFTEFGYQSRPPDPKGFAPSLQAAYINQSEYMAYRNPRVRSFAQFLLVDTASHFHTGLRFRDGRRKPAYAAYRLPIFIPHPDRARPGTFHVWGLLRPASRDSAQTADVQFLSDTADDFQTVAQVPASPRGFVDTYVRFAGSGLVRLAWTTPQGATLYSRTVAISVGG